ncbi:MAG TPA: CHASE2 domain-containing protein [Spirochaetota bacterium]|nr:CHASE2 domain-containing protein [Spirochaetota bacterium]
MLKRLFSSQNSFTKIFIISLTISLVFYIFYLLLRENIRGVEYQIYDAHIQMRYIIKINEKVDYSIINIVINDGETDNTNILSYRKKITKLLIKLKEIKAKSVLIDIIFPEKSDNKTDDELITSVKGLSKVYLPFTYNEKKTFFNFNELQNSIYDSGFNNIYLSDDGILRNLKIFEYNGISRYFFVSFKTACDYLGVKENNIVFNKNNIILKNANLPSGIKKDIRIPLTKDYNFLINYIGVFNKVFLPIARKK